MDAHRKTRTVVLFGHGEARSNGFWENFQVGRRTLGHASRVMRLPWLLRWVIAFLGAARKRTASGEGLMVDSCLLAYYSELHLEV